MDGASWHSAYCIITAVLQFLGLSKVTYPSPITGDKKYNNLMWFTQTELITKAHIYQTHATTTCRLPPHLGNMSSIVAIGHKRLGSNTRKGEGRGKEGGGEEMRQLYDKNEPGHQKLVEHCPQTTQYIQNYKKQNIYIF